MKTNKTWHGHPQHQAMAKEPNICTRRTAVSVTESTANAEVNVLSCVMQVQKQPIHNGPCGLPLSGHVGSETDSTDASLTSHTNQAPTSERQRQVEIEPTLRPLDNTWWRNVWGTDCNIKMCPDYVSRMNSTQSTSLTCASLHTMCIRNVKHNVGRRYYV